MKAKRMLLLLAAFLMTIGIAAAVPITYTESFDFGSQTQGWWIWGSTGTATVNFDIANLANKATYKLYSDTNYDSRSASPDASGFIPGTMLTSANIGFWFWDNDIEKETIQIKATYLEGNTVLAEKVYDLYNLPGGQSAYLSIDLSTIPYGSGTYLTYLQNHGYFSTVVLTSAGDVFLNGASLTAIDPGLPAPPPLLPPPTDPIQNPVPEPTSLFLLGSGLVGLAIAARRRK